jgi:Methylamine utilisation protein MauE
MIDPAVGHIVTLDLAALLAWAAFHKLRAAREFFEVLTAYRLLPRRAASAALHLLPALELLTALGLIVPWSRRSACVAAAGLLLMYGCAIGINLARGRRDLDCGCSLASGRRPIAAWMLMRNGAMAWAALAVALPWSVRPLAWVDMMTIVAGASAAALLCASIDALLGRVAPAAATARAR